MEIVPAFRAFIDESNTPLFEVDLRDNQRPYVACCAIVPFEDQLSVLKAIPRSATSGDRLKSSSREMNDSKAASFIEAVLATETEIAIVGIDGGDSKNVELATKITQKANVFRKQSNRVSISKASAMYLLAARESLFRSLEAFLLRRGQFLSFLDVVFDQASIKSEESEKVSETLKAVFSKRGFRVGSVSWSSEQDEPALFVPDIFSGVMRRQAIYKDLPLSWSQIQAAVHRKRILYKDGMSA